MKINTTKNKKDIFMDLIIHDVTNTINAIQLITQPYCHESNIENLQETIASVNKEAISILEVLNKVRDLESFSVENIKISLNELTIHSLLQDLVDLYSNSANLKNIKLVLNYDDECYENIKVISNAFFLKKAVLGNLLHNAIKFSYPSDTVYIKVSTTSLNVLIQIIDNGIGMSPNLLEDCFNIKPSSSVGTAGEKGTGYGIILAKSFIENMGGEIWATSSDDDRGCGTTFTIAIPKADVNN